jgi:hypothetical protein
MNDPIGTSISCRPQQLQQLQQESQYSNARSCLAKDAAFVYRTVWVFMTGHEDY